MIVLEMKLVVKKYLNLYLQEHIFVPIVAM